MNVPASPADLLRGRLEYLRWQLDSWAEPGGRLIWSETDPEVRAVIRSRIEAEIVALEGELQS